MDSETNVGYTLEELQQKRMEAYVKKCAQQQEIDHKLAILKANPMRSIFATILPSTFSNLSIKGNNLGARVLSTAGFAMKLYSLYKLFKPNKKK